MRSNLLPGEKVAESNGTTRSSPLQFAVAVRRLQFAVVDMLVGVCENSTL